MRSSSSPFSLSLLSMSHGSPLPFLSLPLRFWPFGTGANKEIAGGDRSLAKLYGRTRTDGRSSKELWRTRWQLARGNLPALVEKR